MWAHVADGQIVQKGALPRIGFDHPGRGVSRFDLLPAEDLEAAGWMEVVQADPPEVEPGQQAVEMVELVDGVPTVTWTVKELPDQPELGGHHDPQIGAPDA